MKSYRSHKESKLGRWLRKRQLRKGLPPEREYLVPKGADLADARLTYSEQAEYLSSRAAMDAIEGNCNLEAEAIISSLGASSAALEVAAVERHRAHQEEVAAHRAVQRLRARLSTEPTTRGTRHLSKTFRTCAIVGLGLVDVVAFRAAAAYVLDIGRSVLEYIETTIFAMISIGIVLMAAYSASRIRGYLDAKEREATGNEVDAARRDLQITGLPLLGFAVVSLAAAAILRMETVKDASLGIKAVTVVFSLASLMGAVAIELLYSNRDADDLEDLERTAKKSAKKLKKADKKLIRHQSPHQAMETKAHTLWSKHEPQWAMQADIAAERIAAARSTRPDLFYSLGLDVKSMVEERLKSFKRVLDPTKIIEEQRIGTQAVLDRAAERARTSYGPIAAGNDLVPSDQSGTSSVTDEVSFSEEDLRLLRDGDQQASET